MAFLVDASRGGPSRPLRGPYERYLPSDREGRHGKAYAAAIATQGPPLDLSDKEMDRPPPRACREASMANTKDPEPKMLRLPTKAELDEDYIFGRDHHANVSISTIQPSEGPLTNQRLLNIIYAREVYELLKSDAHHDVSHDAPSYLIHR